MRILSYILFVCSLLWGCTAEPVLTAGEDRLLISAAMDNDTKLVLNDTDGGLEMKWKTEGEALTVVKGQTVLIDRFRQTSCSADGNTATFEGALPSSSATLSILYPAVNANVQPGGSLPSGSNANVWKIDMRGQSGYPDPSKVYMYANGVQYAKGEKTLPGVQLKHITSVLKVQLDFPAAGTVEDISFLADNLIQTLDFSPLNGRPCSAQPVTGPISLSGEFETDADGRLTVWLHFIAEKYSSSEPGNRIGIDFASGLEIGARLNGQAYIANVKRTKPLASGICYNMQTSMKADSSVDLTGSTVEIRDRKLYVAGEEFFIKGVCINGSNSAAGHEYDGWAAESGVNVIRAYSINDFSNNNTTQTNLARIESLGKKGIYVDFAVSVNNWWKSEWNPEVVYPTLTYIRPYLDCPYILMWNIGNEMEAGAVPGSADQTKLDGMWAFIDGMAKLIKENDPYRRPVTTTLAGYWDLMYNDCIAKCPNLDFISINSYTPNVEKLHAQLNANPNYIASGKPYAITEYGPVGTWEAVCPKTSWGAVIEGSANEKAADFYNIHENHIEVHKDEGCIGGFAFLWGYQTHGALGTYYAMFDEFEHYALPQVDGMAEAFGVTVEKKAPVIEDRYDLTIDGKTVDRNLVLHSGDEFKASLAATSSTGVELTYDWYIVKDAYLSGSFQDAGFVIAQYNDMEAAVTLPVPEAEGNYRLLAYARDDVNRKASMASFPFQVSADQK